MGIDMDEATDQLIQVMAAGIGEWVDMRISRSLQRHDRSGRQLTIKGAWTGPGALEVVVTEPEKPRSPAARC
jgi:hypothetical protein